MNGKNFKTFVNQNFNIQGINIFLKLETEEIKQLKYTLKEEQETEMKKVISEELTALASKTPKLYDTYREKDEFFYLNINEIGEIKELSNINKCLTSKNNIESCSNYPGKIKYIIIEIFTEDKKIMFLISYNYNQFFKKKLMGICSNKGFSVEDNVKDNIIINFTPEVIIFDDEIIFTSTNVRVLDISAVFKNCINKNLVLVNDVFKINDIDKINKKQLTYLSRGIFNGNLEKFKNFSVDNKKQLLTKFEEKYNEKYREQVNIEYTGEVCIVFDKLTPRQKEEIIKYTTNRSAYKVLDEQLTTSVD